jgi:hypothetical protein
MALVSELIVALDERKTPANDAGEGGGIAG